MDFFFIFFFLRVTDTDDCHLVLSEVYTTIERITERSYKFQNSTLEMLHG